MLESRDGTRKLASLTLVRLGGLLLSTWKVHGHMFALVGYEYQSLDSGTPCHFTYIDNWPVYFCLH